MKHAKVATRSSRVTITESEPFLGIKEYLFSIIQCRFGNLKGIGLPEFESHTELVSHRSCCSLKVSNYFNSLGGFRAEYQTFRLSRLALLGGQGLREASYLALSRAMP